MKGTLIGIDLGTTALKVAVFDARSGRLLAGAARRLLVHAEEDGRREQDPPAITRALRSALGEVGKHVGDLRGVRGVGLAAQGGSMIIADRDSGHALTPMTLWNDLRALPEFRRLARSQKPGYWRAFSMRDEPGMGLARLLRLRVESTELMHTGNIYAGAGEYLYFHLTGAWRQDAGSAVQIGCYDARREVLIERAAKLAKTPLSFFAPLRRGHETHPLSTVAAKRFGLTPGIPVAGPFMDHEAGFMSVSGVSEKPLQCSLGTAWVGNFQVARNATVRSPFQLVLPSPLGTDRLIVQPLLTGNVTWDWALARFAGATGKRGLEKQSAVFAESVLPSAGLIALPWLNRPNPLNPDLKGGACLLGMGPATSNADLLRAVACGMCYELARVFEHLKSANVLDSVVLSGGASKAMHFRQLISALFAPLPVYQIEEEDWMGARGAVHAFSVAASRSRARRLSAPRLDSHRLQTGLRTYLKAFKAIYGSEPAGKAVSFSTARGKV